VPRGHGNNVPSSIFLNPEASKADICNLRLVNVGLEKIIASVGESSGFLGENNWLFHTALAKHDSFR